MRLLAAGLLAMFTTRDRAPDKGLPTILGGNGIAARPTRVTR